MVCFKSKWIKYQTRTTRSLIFYFYFYNKIPLMERFIIDDIKKHGSRKSKYVTKFEMNGSINKIVEYLKTHNSPLIGNIRTISTKIISDSEIERIMTCPLPIDSIITAAIGNEPVYVKYEIAFCDGMLVSKAIHPAILNSYFKFSETLTITEEGDKLLFERESIVFNVGKQLPFIGSNYQVYDDFFNRSNLEYYWGCCEEAHA